MLEELKAVSVYDSSHYSIPTSKADCLDLLAIQLDGVVCRVMDRGIAQSLQSLQVPRNVKFSFSGEDDTISSAFLSKF